MLRVLLAGKYELAVELLDLLRADPAVSLGVVTCRSESDVPGERVLLKVALAARSIAPLNDGYSHAALLAAVRRFRPDLVISAGFDKIIRPEVIAAVPWIVNVHFGKLPGYRGSYSIPWAILNREPTIGVTLHQIAPGIDDGAILEQVEFPNDPAAACRALYLQAVEVGQGLVARLVDRLKAGTPIEARPQDEQQATYYPPAFPYGFRVPWRQTANYVADYVRACHFPPLAPADTEVEGLRIGVEWPVGVRLGRPGEPPGTIVALDAGEYGVCALNGVVVPGTVLLDGQRLPFSELVQRQDLVGRRCR